MTGLHKTLFHQYCLHLQASFDLPRAVKFDPHTPRISLDSKKVTATHAFTAALKEHLTEILKQPVEARLLTLKPGECACTFSVEDFTCGAVLCKILEMKSEDFIT